MRRAIFRYAFLLVPMLSCACGIAHLQTAKTTPRRHVSVGIGGGVVIGQAASDAWNGAPVTGLPVTSFSGRFGVTDNLDVGAELVMFPGAGADVKYNLLPASWSTALAIRAGLGAGGFPSYGFARVFAAVLASQTIGPVTPYLAGQWTTWWVGIVDPPTEEGVKYASRKGYGDGVFQASAGLEVVAGKHVSLVAEYDLLLPVLDDPGDFYSFARSHVVTAGTRLHF